MFKPTPRLQKMLRRLPLSPKQAGNQYYKGNRVGNLGQITNGGKFIPDYSKIRTYIFPEKGIKKFELTPFVSKGISKNTQEELDKWSPQSKGLTGEEYLNWWKLSGGHDMMDTSAYGQEEAKR
ncbi:hypothetical protein BDV95DRAFT_487875 [Massariosphaeria phaeospora]|uniref:Mitochondrial ribosomal protein L27-domain-containing protein n=1 Tax=Massariosphaeria phaeospora TaxID=100035 RepID=A0A7C8IDG7_9PLEO|nr:hypothetical protein BDV95DRAFT_487875 [Massariosphaeria phaeospora]